MDARPSLSLPSGAVTFVMTDIQGSTRMLRRLGDAYVQLLWRHRELLRRSWAEFGGQEVDCQGDGSLAVFATPGEALAACVVAQQMLHREPWPAELPLRVRMGVHSGLAVPRGSGYVAMALHQAARVAETAHGGQILVSEHTLRGIDRATVDVKSLGRFRVRDFEQPPGLYQVLVPGVPADHPPPRATPADRHNLGAPRTRLIGRDAELAALTTAVERHRLVTVVGAAGVGKTRLVTELGRGTAERWPDGIWRVDCSPLEGGALLAEAVAAALGMGEVVDEVPGGGAWAQVLQHLGPRRLLLVIDGAERHLGSVGRLLDPLLEECPQVHVVITSTEPLHVGGECRFRLAPLSTDTSDAVDLFLERAQELNPQFGLDAEGLAAAATLCRRLDGLPLALEIAAARTPVLHPVQILAGLEAGLGVLSMRDRTRPGRQQTMEGLLEWSFRLLTVDEAEVLRQLSLFAAPFDLATARALTPDLSEGDLAELVWSLADKSLLVADPAAGGTRYRLLETVRTFARERLSPSEKRSGVGRLADLYLDRLGPERGTGRLWMNAMATEKDNVRAVLALEAEDRPEGAQRLGYALARYHDAVQSFHAGITEIGLLVKHLTEPTPARVGLLTALGDLRARIGDLRAAEQVLAEARVLREGVGAPAWDEVGVERLSGDIAIRRGDPAAAVTIAGRALTGALSARGQARMHNLLGIALATQEQYPQAEVAFRAELRAAEAAQDEVLLGHATCNLAEILLRLGDPRAAAGFQRACLDGAVLAGQTGMIALALLGAARVAGDDAALAVGVGLAAKAAAMLADLRGRMYDTDREELEAFASGARRQLGEARYADHWEAGLGLDDQDAIAAAYRVLDLAMSGSQPVEVGS